MIRVSSKEYIHMGSVDIGNDVYKAKLSAKVYGYDEDNEYGIVGFESAEFDFKYEFGDRAVYVEVVNNPDNLCMSVMKHGLAWNGVILVESLESKKEVVSNDFYAK